MNIISIILLVCVFLSFILGLLIGYLVAFRSKKLLGDLTQKIKESNTHSLNDSLVKTDEHLSTKYTARLEDILKPFKENLSEFKERTNQIHTEEIKQLEALKSSIFHLDSAQSRLTKETENLSNALRKNVKLQGNWGENILKTILESSGLVKNQHFYEQVYYKTEGEAAKYLDFVIKLPEGRDIIIDSKVVLNSYVEYFNAEIEQEKEKQLNNIMGAMKKHIDDLSGKKYDATPQLNTIEGVFLFVPIESLFLLLIEKAPRLFQEAYQKKIYLTSPSNLIPLLKVIESLWRVDKQNKNVYEMARIAGVVYEKFIGMAEDLDGVRKSLRSADKNLDNFETKLTGQGNIVRNLEKLKDFGAKTNKEMPNKYQLFIEKEEDENKISHEKPLE
jgi:DNA recombination protein RmuC